MKNKSLILLLLLVLLFSKTYAQGDPCFCAVKTLDVTTGINNLTTPPSSITPGGTDPMWFVQQYTSLSQPCYEPPNTPSYSFYGSAIVGYAYSGMPSSHGKWISYDLSSWLPLESPTHDQCEYSVTYSRNLGFCAAPDNISYDLYINRDNWLINVTLCGVVIYSGETRTDAISNYDNSSPIHLTGTITPSITTNTAYLLSIEVGNHSGQYNNPTLLHVSGTLSTPNDSFFPDSEINSNWNCWY